MNDPDFVAHCLELLSPVGAPRARRMFGGHGVYVDELFVALLVRDTLYLKTDDATRPEFEAAGGQPFRYARGSGEVEITSYWTPPEAALESPGEMLPWARRAMAAAVAARARARAPARKRAARSAATKVAKPPAKKPRPASKGGGA